MSDRPQATSDDHGNRNDDPDVDSSEVDRLGRLAGAALRRPAPADGMRRLHTARRRQQMTRVAAAGATALVFATGAFILTRAGDQQVTTATTPTATHAPPTTAATTTATTAPLSTAAVTSAPPTTEPASIAAPTTSPTVTQPSSEPAAASDAFAAWTRTQRDANRPILTRMPGRGTGAAIFMASNTDPATGRYLPEGELVASYDSTILLPDGRLAPLPDTASGRIPTVQLLGLGDRLAALPMSTGPTPLSEPELFVLDDQTLTWSVGPDLGWSAAPELFVDAWSIDGWVVIGRSGWRETDSDAQPVPGTDGVIVRPDLTVEQIATPPPNVQASWTSVAGGVALSFGYAGTGSAFTYPPAPHPWAFDLRANGWFEVPNPDWMACEAECNWAQPTEGGTPFLEVGTARSALVRVPDGTIGLFDTTTRTWRRIDDAPIDPISPSTATVGDLVVVAPRPWQTTHAPGTVGTVAVLDLVSGSWTTRQFDVPSDSFDWDVRSIDGAVLVQPVDWVRAFGIVDPAVAAVIDASGTWRPVTADQPTRWVRFAEMIDLRAADVA